MSNYNDDDDGGASQTQTAVIEETIGSMMRAMMAVHNDRSGGSQSDQHDVRVSPSNHRRLQMRLLASLDFLAPYRDHAEREWDELGPDGWTPEMIRQRVREGETVTVVPDDEFNPDFINRSGKRCIKLDADRVDVGRVNRSEKSGLTE